MSASVAASTPGSTSSKKFMKCVIEMHEKCDIATMNLVMDMISSLKMDWDEWKYEYGSETSVFSQQLFDYLSYNFSYGKRYMFGEVTFITRDDVRLWKYLKHIDEYQDGYDVPLTRFISKFRDEFEFERNLSQGTTTINFHDEHENLLCKITVHFK